MKSTFSIMLESSVGGDSNPAHPNMLEEQPHAEPVPHTTERLAAPEVTALRDVHEIQEERTDTNRPINRPAVPENS